MKNLKSKFKNELIAPVANSIGSSGSTAKVIRVDEHNNTCTIKAKNRAGGIATHSNVPVTLYNKNIIDWFPSVGDTVSILESDGDFTITGPSYTNYSNIRNNIKIESDIFTTSFMDFLGGSIF